MRFSKSLAPLVLGLAAASLCVPAEAANWLQLQGTQPAAAGPRAKVWGFIQPDYQYTDGTKLEATVDSSGPGPAQGNPYPWNDQKAVFNQLTPDLSTNQSFNIRRARIGVRGTAMPIDPNIDYFILAEFGNNGITHPPVDSSYEPGLTDASVTFNHLKGARFRLGQFKYPGSEEGLQAIHVFDYINFTAVSDQLLLERFFDNDGSCDLNNFEYTVGAGPLTGDTFAICDPTNPLNGPVGAFRDIGLQVFDWFDIGNWQHTYAAMIGNGNGINRMDNNDKPQYYLYFSSERIFGGKGPRREGLKLYGWWQDGERTLEFVEGQLEEEDFDRTRYGVGGTFRRGKFRAGAEYIKADGMIFNGTDGGAVPGTPGINPVAGDIDRIASFNIQPEGEADGWYLDFGYRVMPQLELDVRYDRLNRLTSAKAADGSALPDVDFGGGNVVSGEDAAERRFETVTLGLQWFANKKVRLLANYEFRDAEAPNLPGDATPNQVLDAIDDRFSVQVLAVF
jgi:hypothetical protein